MHFAYPPRKSSDPPPFRPRSAHHLPLLRRIRIRTLLLAFLTFIGGCYLLFGLWSRQADPYREHVPSGNPPVVIVTVVDGARYSANYMKTIEENRKSYAEKHGMPWIFPLSLPPRTLSSPVGPEQVFLCVYGLD